MATPDPPEPVQEPAAGENVFQSVDDLSFIASGQYISSVYREGPEGKLWFRRSFSEGHNVSRLRNDLETRRLLLEHSDYGDHIVRSWPDGASSENVVGDDEMIVEWMPQSLFRICNGTDNVGLDSLALYARAEVARQTACALHYLHKRGIRHGAVAEQHVLLSMPEKYCSRVPETCKPIFSEEYPDIRAKLTSFSKAETSCTDFAPDTKAFKDILRRLFPASVKLCPPDVQYIVENPNCRNMSMLDIAERLKNVVSFYQNVYIYARSNRREQSAYPRSDSRNENIAEDAELDWHTIPADLTMNPAAWHTFVHDQLVNVRGRPKIDDELVAAAKDIPSAFGMDSEQESGTGGVFLRWLKCVDMYRNSIEPTRQFVKMWPICSVRASKEYEKYLAEQAKSNSDFPLHLYEACAAISIQDGNTVLRLYDKAWKEFRTNADNERHGLAAHAIIGLCSSKENLKRLQGNIDDFIHYLMSEANSRDELAWQVLGCLLRDPLKETIDLYSRELLALLCNALQCENSSVCSLAARCVTAIAVNEYGIKILRQEEEPSVVSSLMDAFRKEFAGDNVDINNINSDHAIEFLRSVAALFYITANAGDGTASGTSGAPNSGVGSRNAATGHNETRFCNEVIKALPKFLNHPDYYVRKSAMSAITNASMCPACDDALVSISGELISLINCECKYLRAGACFFARNLLLSDEKYQDAMEKMQALNLEWLNSTEDSNLYLDDYVRELAQAYTLRKDGKNPNELVEDSCSIIYEDELVDEVVSGSDEPA